MPTAGRLAAALAFFIYGWYIALQATPFFPEGNLPGYAVPLSIGVSILVGWMVVGSRAGRGYIAAIGNGLTGAAAYTLWMVFLISFYDMIRKSLRRLYDGPMDAIVDVFALMVDLGQDFYDINLIINVVVGGIICALISEYFAKRYP
ncbi:TrgA family protein [Yoonia sp. SDW83-1]|uniref:TrgA family protein n=1 Tax=Yoonia sp. SDW83-1 TaxID=3366945 RepID=UPI00398C2AF2